MKIASFNINNINRRLSNLCLPGFARPSPTSCVFRNSKPPNAEFPADAIRQAGYHAVWRGE